MSKVGGDAATGDAAMHAAMVVDLLRPRVSTARMPTVPPDEGGGDVALVFSLKGTAIGIPWHLAAAQGPHEERRDKR